MIKYSLNLIFRNKLRTFLTSLGITIAVMLLSLIIFGMDGFKHVITNEFTSRFQPNEVMVSASSFFSFASTPENTEDEEEKIPAIMSQEFVDSLLTDERVKAVTPALIINAMQIRFDGENKAFAPSFPFGMDSPGDAHHFMGFYGERPKLENGEAFVSEDVVKFYKLEYEEVIGRTLILETATGSLLSNKTKTQLDKIYEYEIIGVIETGSDRSDAIITTQDAAKLLAETGGFEDGDELLEKLGFDQLFVEMEDEKYIEDFKTEMREQYNLETFSSDDILDFLGLITTGITLVLVFFGIVSALVASIGIINTMVMSIYEQTREIGINKAVGASNLQVLAIFLIQSGMIGFIGGTLGLLVVLIVTKLLDPFIVDLLQEQGFSAERYFAINPLVLLIIIIACVVVGVIAGIYPAIKAARLDPVRALRYE